MVPDNKCCCHTEAAIHSSFIIVDLHATVDNIKVLSFAIEMLEFLLFPSLSNYKISHTSVNQLKVLNVLEQCFSTAGPWYQLYRTARGSPGICHFSFLSIFHE